MQSRSRVASQLCSTLYDLYLFGSKWFPIEKIRKEREEKKKKKKKEKKKKTVYISSRRIERGKDKERVSLKTLEPSSR